MNKNTAIFAVIIAFAIGLAFLWKRNQLNPDSQTAKLAKIQERMEINRRNQKNRLEARVTPEFSKSSTKENSALKGDAGHDANKAHSELQFQGSSPSSQQLLADPNSNVIEKESITNLSTFSQTAKLYVPNVPGMEFVPYDYDDGVLAVRGVDVLRDIELTLFAKHGVYTEEQLKEFLKSNPEGIPGLDGLSSVNLDEARTIELNAGSGLGAVKYWAVQNGGKTVYVAMIPRQDGKGTYFASLKSSPEVESAEDLYYETLAQLRATN